MKAAVFCLFRTVVMWSLVLAWSHFHLAGAWNVLKFYVYIVGPLLFIVGCGEIKEEKLATRRLLNKPMRYAEYFSNIGLIAAFAWMGWFLMAFCWLVGLMGIAIGHSRVDEAIKKAGATRVATTSFVQKAGVQS